LKKDGKRAGGKDLRRPLHRKAEIGRLYRMRLRAQKSLGQNFLHSKRTIELMLEAGKVDSHDIVLEAGPGKGVLTERLLTCTRQVIAVEKDPRLVLFLSLRFKHEIAEGRLKLIEGDILEFDPASERLQAGGYKVIANIPYYLTGHFLKHILSSAVPPSCMVLLLQREVVRRIIARDGKESILSLSVKAYGAPRYVETVPRGLFTPRPNVDSAVIAIDDISKRSFHTLNEQRFFEIVRKGFSQKRKQLAGNLSSFAPREEIKALFKRFSIPENARAEDVPLAKWKSLARSLGKRPTATEN